MLVTLQIKVEYNVISVVQIGWFIDIISLMTFFRMPETARNIELY